MLPVEGQAKKRPRSPAKPAEAAQTDYAALGNKLLEQGKRDEAIASDTAAIAANPSSANLHQLRAFAYKKKGDMAKATADYSEMIRLAPKDATGYFLRGFALVQAGKLDPALADLTEGLKYDASGNEASEALRMRAYVNAKKKNYVAAAAGLHRTPQGQARRCRRLETNPQVDSRLAYAYLRKGEWDKSLEAYNRVVTARPEASQPLRFRGFVYAQKGEDAKALSDYNKVIELKPDDTYTYFSRGLLYAKMKNLDAARADLEKVISLNPKSELATSAKKRLDSLPAAAPRS